MYSKKDPSRHNYYCKVTLSSLKMLHCTLMISLNDPD